MAKMRKDWQLEQKEIPSVEILDTEGDESPQPRSTGLSEETLRQLAEFAEKGELMPGK